MSESEPDAARFWRRLFFVYLCFSVALLLIVGLNYAVDRLQWELTTAQHILCDEATKENEQLKADLRGLRRELETTKQDLERVRRP